MTPQDGYISYIINPKSGSSSVRLTESLFRKHLIDKGFNLHITQTESLGHACEIATDAAVDFECSAVVVVGGDGTVREVAQGLEGSDKPLMIVPCGTENLLASELGFDEKFKTLVNTFDAGFTKTLDLGSINGKCFTCVAGFGFDGEIVEAFHKKRDGHSTHLDYFGPIWQTFWSYDFEPMKVKVDGQELFDGPCMVFVGNISRYAIGLQILQNADYGDGKLDVCVYKCASNIHLLKHSIMTALKRHIKSPSVLYRQGTVIEVSSSKHIKSQIDGDTGPHLPVKIEVIPKAVKVIVPEHGKPAGVRTRLIRALR